jgi:ATP synthase protein I
MGKMAKHTMTTIPKPPIHRVALYQLLVLLSVSGLLLFVSEIVGFSVLIGGLIQIIPQAWFARQAYKYTGARQVDLMVRAMYRGETGKIVLTAAMFVATFILWKQLHFLAVFSAFIVMIPLQWFITIRILK